MALGLLGLPNDYNRRPLSRTEGIGILSAINRNMQNGAQSRPSTTPAGRYAAGLAHSRDYDYGDQSYQGGLMSNYGAAINNMDRTYMPRVTAGGSFGNPGAQPLGFERGPMPRAQGLMAAPTNAQGYAQQMAAQNPGGRHFGGLLPTMITSPSGAKRPGFLAPMPEQGGTPESIAAANQGLLAKGYQQNSRGQWFRSPGYLASQTPAEARGGLLAQAGGLTPQQAAAGRPAYEQAYAQRQQAQRQQVMNRVGIRQQAQQQREQQQLAMLQQQMQARQFGLLAQYDPRLAMQAMQMQQQGQVAQQQLGLQRGRLGLEQQQLQQQGLLGMQQSQDRRYVADQGLASAQYQAWNQRYSEAIKAGRTPNDAARLAGPQPSAPGQGGLRGPAARQQEGQAGLLDDQIAQVAAAPPEQREAILRAMGVTSPAEIARIQRQLDPNYGSPGWFTNATNAFGSYTPPGMLGDLIGGSINPYGPIAGLFGIRPPPLNRPRRQP